MRSRFFAESFRRFLLALMVFPSVQIGDVVLEASRPPQPGVLQFEEEEAPQDPVEEGEASSTESSALRGAGVRDDEEKGATSSSIQPGLSISELGLPSTSELAKEAPASQETAMERRRTRSQGPDVPPPRGKGAAAPPKGTGRTKKVTTKRRRSDT